jgi:cell division protein ZapE
VISQGPLERYRALIASDRLKPDPEQAHVAAALDHLHQALKHYKPRPARRLFDLFRRDRTKAPPRGLYIHGAVGRGKSLLMDLFFAHAPVKAKRRVHFNAFMMDVHQRIHAWRQLTPQQRAERPEFAREAGEDPIAPVAKAIFEESWLLCFDEFQVTDVADAMILGRLFERLFAAGAVLVVTSNTPPARLYEGGLNRQLFLPFLEMISTQLDVLELGGARDYRVERMAGLNVYNTPLGPAADAAMDGAWGRLAEGASGAPLTLQVMGRPFVVPLASHGVARFSFDALCGQPLGAADYVVLARNFHTVLVDRIPRFSDATANEARRFTLLVDTLYDEKAKLICSAEAPPADLITTNEKTGWFSRTVSRLYEMQSADYLQLAPAAAA